MRALTATLAAATLQLQAQPDIVLDARTRVRPDVVLGDAEQASARLVIEVTEHTTSLVDRVLSPALWANAGLPHFWRLDLEGPVLLTYALEEGSYRETGRFTDQVVIEEPVPLRFRLADLMA